MDFTGKVARADTPMSAQALHEKVLASMQQQQSIYEKITRSDLFGARLFRYNLVSSCFRIETESSF